MTRCLSWILNQRRAAFVGLIGVACTSIGCQGSLRGWRSNDPSLQELIVHPQPWDAELREGEGTTKSPSDKHSGRPDDRYGDKVGGRPNPYSSSALAKNNRQAAPDQRDSQLEELPAYDADDREWAPYLQGLPREVWPTAKKQILVRHQELAARSRMAGQSDEESESLDEEGYVDDEPAGRGYPSAAATSYKFSDRDDQPVADDERPASKSKPKNNRPVARSATQRDTLPKDSGAHFSMRDDDDQAEREPVDQEQYVENTPEHQQPTLRRRVEELTPPSHRKTSRQVAHADPIDTGAGDEMRVMPPRDIESSRTKSKALASQDSKQRFTDSSVVPASATAPIDRSVQPAAAGRPIQQRPVEAPPATESNGNDHSANDGSVSPTTKKKMSSLDHLHEALKCLDAEWSEDLTPSEQLNHQVVKRLVQLASGHIEGALEPIESVGTHEQEFFRHNFQALHHAIDPKGNPVLSRRWPVVLNSQREAHNHLAAVSSLEVKNAAFCSNVDGFGSITKFPTSQFRAGQEVLLYCEIDNFVSEPVKDGFETKLQGSYEIVDSQNVKVAEVLLPQDVEVCRRARRDYFLVYRIYMPQKIDTGRYQLKLAIEDMKGKKYGQSALDFQVGT